MARHRPAAFDDRLTLVEHLDELRSRIIIALVAFGVAFALCFWQNELLLDLANWPLPDERVPITFGVTEPFFTTMVVSAYGALLLSLPVILYEAYAFVLPAFSPEERRALWPYLLAAPLLFVGGVVFSYFIVMPAATSFLLNFNAAEFNIEVRARDYYGFLGVALLGLGVLFQIPIGVMAVTRLGILGAEDLARYRRHAIAVIAVLAAALPGGDPVSMILIMIPLVGLYEASIVLSRAVRPTWDREEGSAAAAGSGAATSGGTGGEA